MSKLCNLYCIVGTIKNNCSTLLPSYPPPSLVGVCGVEEGFQMTCALHDITHLDQFWLDLFSFCLIMIEEFDFQIRISISNYLPLYLDFMINVLIAPSNAV